ncbi:MAG: primosome assembly protein PriA, partial [Nocardioidaceae bacterium]
MSVSGSGTDQPQQLALTRARVRRASPKEPPGPARRRPVARVLVDVGLAHLDRPFDYLVTEDIAGDVRPGCRVKVRFAGKEVAGYVLDRVDTSEHTGQLSAVKRLVSATPVLSPEVHRLCREVADRYAGVLPDVLRLAVPPRHARVEREFTHGAGARPGVDGEASLPEAGDTDWGRYPAGPAYLDRLRTGLAPRAVWTALPGTGWPSALAEAVAATLAGGRGSIVCLPDQRDVERVVEPLRARLGDRADEAVVVTAELGPAARYRAFMRVVTGGSRIVVGTRSAAFAPVRGLGLVAIWDDGDDLHAEPRAPYPHAREVLTIRAHLEQTALLVGGHARTAEAQQLVETGWAQPLAAPRDVVRAAAPLEHVGGGTDHELARDPAARQARLPRRALEAARVALADGPVLVQVPRAGYLSALACVRCRHPARCARCSGPLTLARGRRVPDCRWCGRPATRWSCDACGADRFRAPVVGSQRTAEELGRAFPHVPVVTSSA